MKAMEGAVVAQHNEIVELRKDKKRLDWLEKTGNGMCLIHDDHSRWACNLGGVQPVTQGKTDITKGPIGGAWTYFAEKKDWKKSARVAIDKAMQRQFK